MRIENNYVKGAGGDAITLMYCDRPVIEHNVGDSVSKHINTQDYTQPGSYGGRVAAGIWPWRCKDPVFQYNEMYNNLNAEHGNGDGQAWDADYGDGTLYQYNYSYGNSFASLMICNWYAVNTTFRYNISQNDRQGVFDLPSNGPGNHIYNNTVYVDADSQVLTKRSNSQSLFENNIFINATNTKKTETWNRGSQNGGQTYDNNMYVNYANKPTSDANAIEADDVSAVLAAPVRLRHPPSRAAPSMRAPARKPRSTATVRSRARRRSTPARSSPTSTTTRWRTTSSATQSRAGPIWAPWKATWCPSRWPPPSTRPEPKPIPGPVTRPRSST